MRGILKGEEGSKFGGQGELGKGKDRGSKHILKGLGVQGQDSAVEL